MKTYDEMANSALKRIEEYQEVQKNRSKAITRTVLPVTGICVALLLGIGVWHSGLPVKAPMGAVDSSPTVSAQSTENINRTPSNSVQDDTIVINKIDGMPTDSMRANIGLFEDDFVKMDKAKLNEYYGSDVFPTVPADLTNWDTADDFSGYGVYRRNSGTGEIYFDQTVLNYSNADYSRSVNVEIAKGKLPFICFIVDTGEYEKSVIGGAEVYIGASDAGYLTAQFIHDDVGCIFTMKGLSLDEVVAVIRSIIE